jgi:cell wall-associated NlpC family hydrolase
MAASVQTPVGRAPIMPVLLLGIGAYLAWFGVHYFGSDTKWPSDPVKSVLTGKPLPVPSGQQTAQAIASQVAGSSGASAVSGSATGGVATGSAISDDALRYKGARYVWGGAPGTTPGVDAGTDCSGFANMVVGRDLKLAIPGFAAGSYTGSSHGPTTLEWILFGQPVNLGSELPGDLVVSTVHMGIVIGNGQMISAQDPQLGTGIASYRSGFPGGTPHVRRIAVLGTGTAQAPGTTTAGGRA